MDGFGLMGAQLHDLPVRPFRPAIQSTARLLRARLRPMSRLAQDFVAVLRQVAVDEVARRPMAARPG